MNYSLLLPLGAVIIWAMNSIVSKMSVGLIEPYTISFYRWVLAFIVLTPFVIKVVIKEWSVIKKNLHKLFVLGFLGMMIYQVFIYDAAKEVTATTIAIFLALVPLMTIILSLFILKTKFSYSLLVGFLISFFGVSYLMTEGAPLSLLEIGLGKGEIYLFLASLAYSLYGILIRKWVLPISTWSSLYMQILSGAICLLPFFLNTENTDITIENLPLIIFAGIPASIFAPLLWMRGLEHLGPNKCALFLNLSPVFTAIFAVIIFKDHISASLVIGGSLALLGVLIAQGFTLKKIFNMSK